MEDLLRPSLVLSLLLKGCDILTLLVIFWGLLGLSLLVFFHELGHFFVARLGKIDVEVFSVGLGPVLLRKKDRLGTEFCLSLIPLGGYCKMRGEITGVESKKERDSQSSDLSTNELSTNELPEETLSREKGEGKSFPEAHPLLKIAVVLAGPLANFILAFFFYLMITLFIPERVSDLSTKIIVPPATQLYQESAKNAEETTPATPVTTPAIEAGLLSGDVITRVNGTLVENYSELRRAIITQGGKEIPLEFSRGDEKHSLVLTPRLDPESGLGTIGVLAWTLPVIGSVTEEGWAAENGLQISEQILSLNGKPIENTWDFSSTIKGVKEGDPLTMKTSLREFTTVAPSSDGWGFYFQIPNKILPRQNLVKGIPSAFQETMDSIRLNWQSFGILFRGVKLQKVVSGPMRVIYQTGQITQEALAEGEIQRVLRFIAFVSIVLAMVNLFPIPILDGGQALIFFIEWLRRKPLPSRFIEMYQSVGVFLVLGIFLFSFLSDIFYFLFGR